MVRINREQDEANNTTPHGVSVKRLVKNAGKSYHFTRDVIKQYEAGEIELLCFGGLIIEKV